MDSLSLSAAIGAGAGLLFSLLLIIVDRWLRRFTFKAFNICLVGLILGLFMSRSLIALFDIVLPATAQFQQLAHAAITLASIYLAMVVTARLAEDFYIALPFVKLRQTESKKKDLLVSASLLADTRIIDFAA